MSIARYGNLVSTSDLLGCELTSRWSPRASTVLEQLQRALMGGLVALAPRGQSRRYEGHAHVAMFSVS
jgi:hypothetical protein